MAKRKQKVDFLEEEAKKPTGLDEVMAYVEQLDRAMAEEANLSEKLKVIQQERKKLEEETIPMFLASNGLEELKLSNGRRVTVKEDVYCRLPEDPFKREEALSWLAQNGGADKIKDEATIEAVDPDIVTKLDSLGIPYSRRQTVNTMSLMAWFRDVVGLKKGSIARIEVDSVPKSFGLYIKKTAKLA